MNKCSNGKKWTILTMVKNQQILVMVSNGNNR